MFNEPIELVGHIAMRSSSKIKSMCGLLSGDGQTNFEKRNTRNENTQVNQTWEAEAGSTFPR